MSSRSMRFGYALLLAGVLATWACTDGVGMPIREALESDPVAGDAGDRDAGVVPRGCDNWPAEVADSDSESELLEMLNFRRGVGQACNGRQYEPRAPLEFSRELRCAARLHSIDMATAPMRPENYPFTRGIGSDGSVPPQRMEAAGFDLSSSSTWGELRVQVESSAREADEDLFREINDNRDDNDGCQTVAGREFTHIGVGRYQEYWTIDFGEAESADGHGGP